MDIRTTLTSIARHWLIALTTLALCFGVAFGYTRLAPKTYESHFTLFLATKPQENTDLLNSSAFSQQRTKSYSYVINSPIVLQPVIDKLRLDSTVAGLSSRIVVEVPLDSVVIDVRVRDNDPQWAAAIGREMVSSFRTALPTIEGGRTSPVTMSVLRPAAVPVAPVSPQPKIILLAGIFTGLLLGALTALAAEAVAGWRGRRNTSTRADFLNESGN